MSKYDLLLEQFIFLGALLQSMDVELDIDEHDLTIEDFQRIDYVLEPYLQKQVKGKLKKEVVALVREISKAVAEEYPNALEEVDAEPYEDLVSDKTLNEVKAMESDGNGSH